jgi:hypothetical protein
MRLTPQFARPWSRNFQDYGPDDIGRRSSSTRLASSRPRPSRKVNQVNDETLLSFTRSRDLKDLTVNQMSFVEQV